MSDVDVGLTTSRLARDAAASTGLNKRVRVEATAPKDPPTKRTNTSTIDRTETQQSSSLSSYKIPFKNSSKFPKEQRPDHLKDDDVFDMLPLSDVATQLAMWAQTKATLEQTALKMKKAEKSGHKSNTAVKKIMVEEGEHDAMTVFHPQQYTMRPSVLSHPLA